MTAIIKRVFIVTLVVSCLLFGGCTKAQKPYPTPEAITNNLTETVAYLSEIKPARNYRNRQSLEKAADYISDKFAEYGLEPERQKFTVANQVYSNIIASVGTSKDNSEVVVVGAHYDVCGNQPGADDNASGIAGLLEIARFAKEHEDQLRYRIEFVAYCLEEPPFFGSEQMGSYFHAKSLFDEGAKVKGMICLEMIGFFTDAKGSQKFPPGVTQSLFPSEGNFIAVVGNSSSSSLVKHTAKHMETAPIKVKSLIAPSFVKGVDFSDQRNYWKFGYNAVMVTDTAFFRNPNYHKKTDTIETLSFDKIQEVVKGVCRTILNF